MNQTIEAQRFCRQIGMPPHQFAALNERGMPAAFRLPIHKRGVIRILPRSYATVALLVETLRRDGMPYERARTIAERAVTALLNGRIGILVIDGHDRIVSEGRIQEAATSSAILRVINLALIRQAVQGLFEGEGEAEPPFSEAQAERLNAELARLNGE
jgi:hypothetical protein